MREGGLFESVFIGKAIAGHLSARLGGGIKMPQELAETLFEQKVKAFSKLMIEKLETKQYENDDTWDVCSTNYLVKRMYEEITEIVAVLHQEPAVSLPWEWHPWQKRLALECADVANFAMMIADRLGNLGKKDNPKMS